MPSPLRVFLCGPTGTGKTEVALELATLINGEIISADSMLIYRGMDVGTAKPTLEQRSRIRHHLIDVVSPLEEYNVARYQQQAQEAIEGVRSRGHTPIIAGGTGLYFRALTDDLPFPAAPPNDEVRSRLMEIVRDEGAAALHARLELEDPDAAARIHPHNVKRVVRALEIIEATRHPVAPFPEPPSNTDQPRANDDRIFGLTMDREHLYARLDARIDLMMASGFLQEVLTLRAVGVTPQHLSQQGLGYRQLHQHLDGRLGLKEALELWKRDTRRYAKRQWTWFRKDLRVQWIEVDAFPSVREIAAWIASH